MSTQNVQAFENRVFGCVIVKAINANYNADFSHQPRKLPNGTVYATDKALKYSIRNYFDKTLSSEKIFYFKRLKDDMQPTSLDETYVALFGKIEDKANRKVILKNILSCLDIRLFGATYADKKNSISLSIHGPVQITHGMNQYCENIIYSERIMSPFRNPGEESTESQQSTLGSQSKLQEGHYVHHFSVNPKNIADFARRSDHIGLSHSDVEHLKDGLCKGVTFYDSAAKAGCENELMLWVELIEGSTLVLPSFVELVTVGEDKKIDLTKIKELLSQEHVKKEIKKIELYYNSLITTLVGKPDEAIIHVL